MKFLSRGRISPALIWGLFFSALVVGAIVFGSRQIKMVVVHGQRADDSVVQAFDAGVLSAMRDHPGIRFRSLRVTAHGDLPQQYCAGVWYALRGLNPDVLIVVGEAAQRCVDDPVSGIGPAVPRVLMDVQEKNHAVRNAQQVFLPHEVPVATWSDALRSQRPTDKDYRVMFLAVDSVLGRAQQKAFVSLALERVKISNRLVTSWAQWEEAARTAAAENDLLVIGSYRELKGKLDGASSVAQTPADAALAVVKMTQATFGKNTVATEASSVDAGALWSVEPEPGSLGRRAAQTGLVLLGELPPSAVSAQTVSIAVNTQLTKGHHGLPPLFEAVARYQGLYR